jgi:acyl-CoA reductase-like NAD-dependent aldehyde dehydrogenase
VESGTAKPQTSAGQSQNGGNGSAPENTFEVTNPATGELIREVGIDSPQQVSEVVARVRANQAEWEALGNKGRHRWLAQLRDWLIDNHERVADTMQAETGKVRVDATSEAVYLTDLINFYGARADKVLGDDKVKPHSPLLRSKKLRVQYRPFPVVGIISPWNFPLILSLGDAIPALQAGAAVVIKPSEVTPLGLAEIVEAWKTEIGAPDVFDCVQGVAETATALIDEVDFVQFTGSDRTGRKVMARAAETLTPVSLELGGNDAMIVLRDANIKRAANAAAWGGFANSGQVCISAERVYVEEPVYDEFVARLTEEVEGLRQGADGTVPEHEIGAMTAPMQTEIVERHVTEAVDAGARALTGGSRRDGPGDYYRPTVLVDVDHSMEVMREETFGPVIGVMKVRDSEEAVRMANDSRHGLSGSVFGAKRHAEQVARKVECGVCNVNDVMVGFLASDVPFGGWKDSGIGYRHGEIGLKKFCRTESLVITRFGGDRELLWFPYTEARSKLLRRLTRFFNARGRRRFGGG